MAVRTRDPSSPDLPAMERVSPTPLIVEVSGKNASCDPAPRRAPDRPGAGDGGVSALARSAPDAAVTRSAVADGGWAALTAAARQSVVACDRALDAAAIVAVGPCANWSGVQHALATMEHPFAQALGRTDEGRDTAQRAIIARGRAMAPRDGWRSTSNDTALQKVDRLARDPSLTGIRPLHRASMDDPCGSDRVCVAPDVQDPQRLWVGVQRGNATMRALHDPVVQPVGWVFAERPGGTPRG